eukprot:GILI01041374.1.p1 GENE.GILI01041374.1~~GILI01041374.1.p1  ORF type:complete len:368 (-),score=33.75 GILI01041374.1:46-1107(-)
MSGFMFDFSSPQDEQEESSKSFDGNAFQGTLGTFTFAPIAEIHALGCHLRAHGTWNKRSIQDRVIFNRHAPQVDTLECAATSSHEPDNTTNKITKDVTNAGDGRKDIVQGAYYGGLKVWSCAPDVAEVVLVGCSGTTNDPFGEGLTSVAMRGSSIVIAELGCGQTIPSLACLHRLWASEEAKSSSVLLFLHDYNKEVIDEVSVPNVAMNYAELLAKLPSQQQAQNPFERENSPLLVGTSSGDWSSLAAQSFVHPQRNPQGSVDILLAADVTFDIEATEKFVQVAARTLRRPQLGCSPGGMAIVGTKDYYFGTGGGVSEMQAAIRKFKLPLELSIIERRENGALARVLCTLRRI